MEEDNEKMADDIAEFMGELKRATNWSNAAQQMVSSAGWLRDKDVNGGPFRSRVSTRRREAEVLATQPRENKWLFTYPVGPAAEFQRGGKGQNLLR